jgi:hypothetical protein
MKMIICLLVLSGFLSGCKSYYMGEGQQPMPIYSDQYGSSVIYTIPAGEQFVVMRGYGNYCYAQYRDYYGWIPSTRIHFLNRLSKRNLYNYYTSYGSYTALSSTAGNSISNSKMRATKRTRTFLRNAPGNGSHERNRSARIGGRGRH